MDVLRLSGGAEGYADSFVNTDHIESMSAYEKVDTPNVYMVVVRTASGQEYVKKFYDRGARNAYILTWAGLAPVAAPEEDG